VAAGGDFVTGIEDAGGKRHERRYVSLHPLSAIVAAWRHSLALRLLGQESRNLELSATKLSAPGNGVIKLRCWPFAPPVSRRNEFHCEHPSSPKMPISGTETA